MIFLSGVVNSKLLAQYFGIMVFADLGTEYPCREYQGRLVMVTRTGMLFDIDSEEKLTPVNSQIPPSLQQIPKWNPRSRTRNPWECMLHPFDFLESSLLLYESIQEKNKKRIRNAKDATRRKKYFVKHYIFWFENMFPTQRFLLPIHLRKSNYIRITLGGNGTFMLCESGRQERSRSILLFT